MGWVYGYYCYSIKDIEGIFNRLCPEGCVYVSKGYLVKSDRRDDLDIREYYRAIKKPDGSVIALASFVDVTGIRKYGEIGLRWDTEYVCSLADHCPSAVFDMLTPTDNPYALEWRYRCADYLCRLNMQKRFLKKINIGDIIRFDDGLRLEIWNTGTYRAGQLVWNDEAENRIYTFEVIRGEAGLMELRDISSGLLLNFLTWWVQKYSVIRKPQPRQLNLF